jgi:hypothetical protein
MRFKKAYAMVVVMVKVQVLAADDYRLSIAFR